MTRLLDGRRTVQAPLEPANRYTTQGEENKFSHRTLLGNNKVRLEDQGSVTDCFRQGVLPPVEATAGRGKLRRLYFMSLFLLVD